ncbi:iron-containing alcohol dehydrogenase [Paracoccus sp. Z330]|uniref:Iron-containing alcohol dehydrogenase n=1 Tax=Paracoccus onchidii TaxID=3017813 RepID=A0ABT4ZEN2_9RHOB|nr:iron-containing alcohol dehydrogenase [Paracoccus onchidii]MDB6177572.1 iron-containing alcohol dehydrogenase [Paracoccus onchidii]
MTTAFAFATATEILFGRGQADTAAARISALGKRLLLVRGQSEVRSRDLAQALTVAGCQIIPYAIAQEPELSMIERGVALAREHRVDAVLAIGGGAVIDAGKAIAGLVPGTRPILDHLEVVGRGLPLEHAPLPFVAMPTTAGTGAEVTRNAVIGVPEHRRKVSLRDPRMLPRLAIIDPALTDNCPRGITLASGLDAITQVIEPFVCTRANHLTDALCRDAIGRGLTAIRRLMQAEDPEARDEMAWVSLCGGFALANSGLGAVHGLAGPLGGLSKAPHGAICGALLPHVLRANRRAVTESRLLARLDQVALWINAAFGDHDQDMERAASRLETWSREAGLARLSELGVSRAAMETAAVSAAASSSMKANPAALSAGELHDIMLAAG